jgi:thioredoxin 1
MAIELNRDNYEAEAQKAPGAVLVDFWGPLCKPCIALMPGVEQIEQDFSGRLKVGKVNSTQNRMLCARLRVMTLPTFILYRDGEEKARLTGEDLKAAEIRAAVETVLAQG